MKRKATEPIENSLQKKRYVYYERDDRGLPLNPTPEIMEHFCSKFPKTLSAEELATKSQFYQFQYQHAQRFKNQEEVTELPFEKSGNSEEAWNYWISNQYLKKGAYTYSFFNDDDVVYDRMRALRLLSLIESRARGLAVHDLTRSTKGSGNIVNIGDATKSQFELVTSILNYRYGKEGDKEQRYYYYEDEYGEHQREFVLGMEYNGMNGNFLPALEHPFWFIKKIRNPKTGILFKHRIYKLNILWNPVTTLMRIEIEFNSFSFNGTKWISV